MNTYTTQGYYGSNQTPCHIFVVTDNNYLNWYVIEDSCSISATYEPVELGSDTEILHDIDCMTTQSPVQSEDELFTHVAEYLDYLEVAS